MPVHRVLWGVALAALFGIAAEFILIDADWTPPASRPPEAPAVVAVNALAGANGALLNEIGQRPLFLEARRPPEPVVAEAAPAAPAVNPLDGVELLGVYESGGHAGVILRRGGEVSRVPTGVEWQGWRLLAVSTTKAIFTSADGTTQELPLARQPQQGGMVAAPAAPAAPAGPPGKGKKPDVSTARPATPVDRQAALRAAQARAAQTRAAQTQETQTQ
ncbi:MAG: hypothetical protein IPH23_04210 [Gammaproteobacteria bacterium]|nr:hypothetical protein [Gammaproteobacteria bacterium]